MFETFFVIGKDAKALLNNNSVIKIVKIKDPVEYLKRLEFHNNVKNYQDYFF